MTEAEANLSFDHLKRGDRIQVDIHHPRIVALVNAGYLKIVWKVKPDAQNGPAHSDRQLLPSSSGGDLGGLPLVDEEEEVADGTGDDISQPGDSVFEATDETSR